MKALAIKGCSSSFSFEIKARLVVVFGSLGPGLCLPAARLHRRRLLTPCWDFLVSVRAEMCSLKEMVLVRDVHMQGCHSLVILQRVVLLLTFC